LAGFLVSVPDLRGSACALQWRFGLHPKHCGDFPRARTIRELTRCVCMDGKRGGIVVDGVDAWGFTRVR